jgi:hypothetical protein
VDRAVNVLAFGLPGRGKTHFLAALGRELILRHSKRVLFRPAFKLVGQLLAAKRDLRLESELKKLDRYDVLILDDIGYVQQSREEMDVLFTLLVERYERRSILIRSNLVFSQRDQIFKDPLTTMAAIDRLVHHAIILEFDGASQRVKKAGERIPPLDAGQVPPGIMEPPPQPPPGRGGPLPLPPPKSPQGDFSPPVPQGSGGKHRQNPASTPRAWVILIVVEGIYNCRWTIVAGQWAG